MGLLDSEISKDIRTRLLKRNIVSSTVERNGLSSLLYSIGKPAVIGGIPPNIVDSEDLEDIGSTVRDFMLVNNKYIATPIEYERISINTISSDITTQYPNYLERVSNLVGGGASSNASNVINGVLGGLVPRYSIGGGNPLFDVTSILSGGRSNPSNETPLGIIGANQLGFAIQVNSAFNLRNETIGRVNTNPISLLMGNPIIFPNYNITVAKGTGGVILDYAERILGFNTPVSLLDSSSSIFYRESGNITNVERANNMLANTGKGQVNALFWLMNQNRYKATYVDPRDPNGGVRGDLYAFQYGQGDTNGGYIIDMLNGDDNNPISKSNYDLEGMVRDSGFRSINEIPKIDDTTYVDVDGELYSAQSEFTWEPYTKLPSTFSDKSILSKTKKLFESGKLKWNTVDPAIIQSKTETNSAVYDKNGQGYMSTGSGSIKFNGITPESDPSKMFFRTFNKVKQYDRVKRLQKHSGVNLDAGVSLKKDGIFSVLDDNGFVKVAPYSDNLSQQSASSLPSTEVKKYMFSIENLAWYGYTNNLIPEEVGNGDPITGKKGRIMWFPPYDLSFTDNTSVDWEKTNFIGRGEPIYTYNNTTRTGNLQFKIIIDHPSYVNSLKGESDDLINSLFTGGFEVDKRVRNLLSADQQVNIELNNNTTPDKVESTAEPTPANFELYFPFNSSDFTLITSGYEDGINIPVNNPNGSNLGIGSYVDDQSITRIDDTNYGLNKGFASYDIFDNIDIFRACTGCKVNITAYGVSGEKSNLNNNRIESVKNFFQVWKSPEDLIFDKRFISEDGGNTQVNIVDDNGNDRYDFRDVKNKIKVTVEFQFDAKLKEEANPTVKPKETPIDTGNEAERTVNSNIKSRFYTEEGYFRKLEQEDKFVYDSISQKIAFFHPAFHSITPEGFNSRLTFLQQCTRQGPTVFQKDGGFDLNRESDALSPDNMAFGQPPVCILRLGDFYYTKIIIDSVNFSFDPLVWDLNPEGIGVQPMICTVDLNFAFVGGSSLQGPISKLQNAVTYNFFANTQIYEPASNYVASEPKSSDGDTTTFTVDGVNNSASSKINVVGGGEYYPGRQPETSTESTPANPTGDAQESNQQAEAEVSNGSTQPSVSGSTSVNDFDRITITTAYWDNNTLRFNIGRKDGTDNTALSSNYNLSVTINKGGQNSNINYNKQVLNATNLNQQYNLAVTDINGEYDIDTLVSNTLLKVCLTDTEYCLTSNITNNN